MESMTHRRDLTGLILVLSRLIELIGLIGILEIPE